MVGLSILDTLTSESPCPPLELRWFKKCEHINELPLKADPQDPPPATTQTEVTESEVTGQKGYGTEFRRVAGQGDVASAPEHDHLADRCRRRRRPGRRCRDGDSAQERRGGRPHALRRARASWPVATDGLQACGEPELAEAYPEAVLNLPPRPHQVAGKPEGG